MPDENCDITKLSGIYNVVISSHFNVMESSYVPNYECSLHLSVPSIYLVNVTFTHFDLQAPVDDVCVDYVQLFVGYRHEIPLTERLCGNIIPRPIISNTSDITLTFSSDAVQERTGFMLHYGRIHKAKAQSIGLIKNLEAQIGTYQKHLKPPTSSSTTILFSISKYCHNVCSSVSKYCHNVCLNVSK